MVKVVWADIVPPPRYLADYCQIVGILNSDDSVVSILVGGRYGAELLKPFLINNLGYAWDLLPEHTGEIIGRDYIVPTGKPKVPKWDQDGCDPTKIVALVGGATIVVANCESAADAEEIVQSRNSVKRQWYWDR